MSTEATRRGQRRGARDGARSPNPGAGEQTGAPGNRTATGGKSGFPVGRFRHSLHARASGSTVPTIDPATSLGVTCPPVRYHSLS